MKPNLSKLLAENAKLLIYLAILIALMILFFSFRKKANQTSEDEGEKALDDLKVKPDGLSISENEAIVKAENLLAAMNQYGTDEQAIKENLTGLNKEDLLLIMKKFGVKPHNGAGLATRSYEKAFFSQDLNLIGWLRREISGSDLGEIQSIFNQNGISF